jgi:hypothetical protein
MKISNLPKTATSSDNDLISIVQGGVTKSISKQDLLGALSFSISQIAADVSSLKTKVSKNTISKDTPVFNNSIIAPEGNADVHLTTKGYVDSKLFNTVKNDGSTKLINSLSFLKEPETTEELDLVYRGYVDAELRKYLGVPQPYNENVYPQTFSAGECFILTSDFAAFATNGPEVQSGDILIALSASSGGTHGEVGNQFAIINTNVVVATEDTAGILRVSSDLELVSLDSDDSALTPSGYKKALETDSSYNRTEYQVSNIVLNESDKGIIAVDTRRDPATVTLPSIEGLQHGKLVKYTIKDEYANASKNNITITASPGNTIQNSLRYKINDNGGAVTLYTNGISTWYVESNVFSNVGFSTGVKSVVTDDVVNGEQAVSTGAYEAVLSTEVNLTDYPIGTGFKIVVSAFTAANSQTKTLAIGIGGNQVLESSGTTVTAPNAAAIVSEFTLMHTNTTDTFGYGKVLVGTSSFAQIANTLSVDWGGNLTVSADVNNATAAGDIKVYSLQIIPLR